MLKNRTIWDFRHRPSYPIYLLKDMLTSITNPSMAAGFVRNWMCQLDHEEVWAVFLTGNNSVICDMMLSKGTLTQTSIDCRTVLRNALLVNAASLILLHNHPSGTPLPSVSDINFTNQLRKVCALMDILLLDHIIITADTFYSFAEESTLKY